MGEIRAASRPTTERAASTDMVLEVKVMAKRFFYVCAGLFLLAAAYHLGA